MIRKLIALFVVNIALVGCSTNVQHTLRVMSECYGFNDRTCEANQKPEYRTDSLNGPTVVIIKYE